VLVLAQEEARLLNHSFIGTEHILLGLIHEGEGLAAKALESLGISLEAVREKVEETIGPAGTAPTGSPPFTPRAKKVLELSLREALQLGHNYIGTEHMLLGLVREGEGVAAQVLQSLGADLPRVRQQVIQLLSGYQGRDQAGATGVTDVRGLEWPRHPTRVIAGPEDYLRSDVVEFRVTGVLQFAEGIRVMWRISGIPKAVADLLGETRFTPGPRPDTLIAYVSVSDDLDTTYSAAGSIEEPQPGGQWAGTAFFTPAVPDGASRLGVKWQGTVLQIDLG